jgi:hypothetical protein
MPWLDAYCCENATASSYRADRAGVIFTWGTQRWQRAAAEGCAVVDSCCCYCTSTAIQYTTVLYWCWSIVQYSQYITAPWFTIKLLLARTHLPGGALAHGYRARATDIHLLGIVKQADRARVVKHRIHVQR